MAELAPAAQRAWLHREGEFWTMACGDAVVHLRDGKGLHYLAALTEHAGTEIHAADLATAGPTGRLTAAPADPGARADAAQLDATGDLGDAGAVLDETAKRAYKQRLAELREELDEAESFHDPERASRAREELEFLQRELASAVGLGGRDRRSASASERARVNVTRALKGTIRRVSEQAPTLGRYLELSVKTGIFCALHPPPGFELVLGEPAAPAEPAHATAAPPAAAPAAPTAGRALRTLVFVELVGSLELAARLGDEHWRRTLTEHDASVEALATRYAGRAEPRFGDQTLVVFDGSDAGVLFAESVVTAARSTGLAVRAGVHTGECELLGTALVGIAVHAAARMTGLARPGEVLVSEAAHDLASGAHLEFADRGTHALRGVAEEWRVFALEGLEPDGGVRHAPAVVGMGALALPSRLRTAGERPLFGRSAELSRLREAVVRARDGGRPFMFITGEPGIGKTRLAAEAARLAHDEGATVLYGRCDPDLGVPYQAFAEALTHYAEHAPEALAERLTATPSGALARIVPALAGSAAGPPGTTGAPDRHVLFAEAAAVLATNPWPPLVIVLDDLHWADDPTLALLRYLFHAPAPAGLLVIATYRSTELADSAALAELLVDVGRAEHGERMELHGLEHADVLALTAHLVGRDLPPALLDLARSLTTETQGNAFFLTEVLRDLAESGDFERAESGWEERGTGGAAIELPGSVRETVSQRVTRLGPTAEELLATAATMGTEFELGLLCRAVEVEEDAALDVLDGAITAGLVVAPTGVGRRYRFAHALVGHTLYQELPAGQRRRTHRRIATVLEEMVSDTGSSGRVAELAGHLTRGAYSEDGEKAVHYARLAGDNALAQLAPQEGERWYARALELLAELPDQEPFTRCELLIGLGRAQCQSGNAEFRTTLLGAAELARELRDHTRLVDAALANTRGFVSSTGEVDTERIDVLEAALSVVGDNTPERARLLATLAAELTFAGDWERRRALGDEALEVARRTGDAETIRDVLGMRFISYWTPETLEARCAGTEEELALARDGGDRLARFRALHWHAVTRVETGDLREAARLVDYESRLADELGQPTTRWLAAYDRATRALMRGLLDEAETWVQSAGEIAGASGQPEALAFYVGQLLNVRFEQGRLGELEPAIADQVRANPGIPAFRAALALAQCECGKDAEARALLDEDGAHAFATLSYDSNWLVGVAIYAEACGRVGGEVAAQALYDLLEPWAGQVAFNSATTWGAVDRHLGNLAQVLGRHDEAERWLRGAAEAHERMGAPIWLARTRLDLARILPDDDAERRGLLEQAMATARELGCATIESRAANLLETS